MTLPMALKQLRGELHLKQKELAMLLYTDATTVNRWETGKNVPKRSMAMLIINTARAKGVSQVCQDNLKDALFYRSDTEEKVNDLRYTEISMINELVNDSANGVIVIGTEDYDILYANNKIAEMNGISIEDTKKMKCYQFMMNRDTPCPFCRKYSVSRDSYNESEFTSSFSGKHYLVRGKEITWAGKKAQLKYVIDTTEMHNLKTEAERIRESLNYATHFADMSEIEIQTRWKGEEVHWTRFQMNLTDCDEKGNPEFAVCSVQTIDREKSAQSRILFEHKKILEDSRGL